MINGITKWFASYAAQAQKFTLWAALISFAGSLLLWGASQFFTLPLPPRMVPATFLQTIITPLSLLLIYELIALVLATTGSFVVFVLREFEVVSLIVLRDLFKRLDELQGGFQVMVVAEVGVIAFGSVVLYFLIELVERMSVHFVEGELKEELPGRETKRLAQLKGILELILLIFLAVVVTYEVVGYILGIPGTGLNTNFVRIIFGGLIAYSIALLLIVLLINNRYEVLFEHSALVLAAVVVLVSLEATPFAQIPMIIASMSFVIATLFLHGFTRGKKLSYFFTKVKN